MIDFKKNTPPTLKNKLWKEPTLKNRLWTERTLKNVEF